MNNEYYLNCNPNCSPTIPTRYSNYLDREKYLSEFNTNYDKEIARRNLGITDIIELLNSKIDNKVIERGSVPWDLYPTEEGSGKILSSAVIYNTLLKYVLLTDLDILLLNIWNRIINKINKTYNQVEEELNELNSDFTNKIDCIKNDPIIRRVDRLELLVKTFLKTSGGTAIDYEFGNSDDVTVSQKTLTSAINKIWEKLEDITGEVMLGINMVVTPDYFISEDGCNVHIKANTVETNGIFEHIAFYINGTLIAEADNVDFFEYDTTITETSVIKCVAKIMGIEYPKEKIVTHYNSFWLGAGNTYSDIMDVEHVIPITNGMRGAYDVNVAQGDHIIIVVGESLASGFLRADMNSVEIQFTESTVAVGGNSYRVFTSENVYTAGTYNIDING